MRRAWLWAIAFLFGVGGFVLGIALDGVAGSASRPGGPEIVLVIAIAATLAAVAILAGTLGQRTWTSLGLAVLLAGAGFASAYGGFLGLYELSGGCGYTSSLSAEAYHEGAWRESDARAGLEAGGLNVERVRADTLIASRSLDQASMRVYVSDASEDRGPNASDQPPAGIRVSASFLSEDSFGSSGEARNWTEEHRPRFEDRFATFQEAFAAETGWQQAGEASWDSGVMVC